MKGVSLKSSEIMADDYAGYVDEKPWNAHHERPCTLSLLGSVEELDILDAGCAAGGERLNFTQEPSMKL